MADSRPRIYNRRPATVEAMSYDGSVDSLQRLTAWVNRHGGKVIRLADESIEIQIGRSHVNLDARHTLVREATGMFYIYEDHVFKAMYI